MRYILISFVITVQLLTTSCSETRSEFDAQRKIAKLEAQLVAEKLKNSEKSIEPATATIAASVSVESTSSQKPSEVGNQWRYSAIEDKMNGGKIYYAAVDSSNTVNFKFPYSGEQHGKLMFRSDRKNRNEILFIIEKGQTLCNSFQECSVSVRFDDEKPTTFSGMGPADNSSETVFISNYSKFYEKIRTAKIVRISTNIYQEGSPIFEFNVSDFNRDKYIKKNNP